MRVGVGAINGQKHQLAFQAEASEKSFHVSGAVGRTAYSATKAGIVGMGRSWALELAPFGITVNMVAPGPVEGTAMFHELVPAGGDSEAALAAAIPMKRLGQPADVVNAVMFFAARQSGFITGQVLYVCGGLSVGTAAI